MKLFQSLLAKDKKGSWLLNPARCGNKIIERVVFYSIILFLPTQLGRHFWPSFSFVQGLRIDYLSPTLYVTDVLIGVLFLIWLQEKIKSPNKIFPSSSIKRLFLLLVFLVTGLYFSKNQAAGFYGLIKLVEFIFFGYYTAKNADNFKTVVSLFSIGIIFEGLLSILQFFNKSSLDYFLYYFGERSFNSQTPGIANVSLGGELFLRPYGTFSHPNVLAGYLTIAMVIAISKIKDQRSKIKELLYSLSLIIGTIALFLTMSRVAIFIWLLILGGFILRCLWKTLRNNIFSIRLFVVLVLIGSLCSIFFLSPLHLRFLEVSFNDQAFIIRKDLTVSSVLMLKNNLFFGVGINNFLPTLPSFQKQNLFSFFEYLQPVHNIYFLIAAESGIVGLIFFIWFILRTYQQIKKSSLFIILSSVLILGFFDHYFLTIQQGQLLLAFVFGICWSTVNRK